MLLDTALLLLSWFWLQGQILWHESTVKKVLPELTGQAKLQPETSQEDRDDTCDFVFHPCGTLRRTKRSSWDKVCLAQPCCLWNVGSKQKLLGGALLLPMKVINSVR